MKPSKEEIKKVQELKKKQLNEKEFIKLLGINHE